MKYRYHHLHLICSDLEEMIHFFSETLGAELVARRKFGTSDGASLDLSGVLINLRVAREHETVVHGDSKTRFDTITSALRWMIWMQCMRN